MKKHFNNERIRVFDKHEVELHKLLKSSNKYSSEALRAYTQLETTCRKKHPNTSETLSGVEAANYLEILIQTATIEIKLNHESYGSVRWLWYLRRVPNELFAGSYGSTLAYRRFLAEVITGSFHENESFDGDLLHYPINDSTARQIARMIGRIKFLSMLHVLYRCVGKELELDLKAKKLNCINDEKLDSAMRMYDQRQDAAFGFKGSRIGLADLEVETEHISSEKVYPEALLFLGVSSRIEIEVPVIYEGKRSTAWALANFAPYYIQINKIIKPFLATNDNPYLEKISSLVYLHLLIPRILRNYPKYYERIVKAGYMLLKEDFLRELYNKYSPSLSNSLEKTALGNVSPAYEDWISSFAKIPASTWPLRVGKVIRRIEDRILLDLASSSRALIHNIELDRRSQLVTGRDTLFELECQQIIDASSWKPNPIVGKLRRKQLRKERIIITDIDAIGSKGDTLLIIDCASIIYDDKYDKGCHGTIRNAQSIIDKKVKEWNDKVEFFKSNPVGDNYDFTKFKNIGGVVCTPFAAYSSNEFTYREISLPSLRACISSEELKLWLSKSQ